ncbi:MAG: hypothetical protein ACLFMX_01455 [Halobacteriales archaeon]
MPPRASLYCPGCATTTDHRLVASTRLHLGRKRKWRCLACERQSVTVDGRVAPDDVSQD